MKVSFEYTKKEYKKFLIRSRLINNIILFVIGLAIYLLLTLNKISLVYLPLFIIGLIVLIILLNIVYATLYIKANDMMNKSSYGKYTLELSQNKFSVTANKIKTDYKYNNIRKIKETKRELIIKMNSFRETLTFERNKFSEEDFNKMIEIFKKRSNC